MTDMHTDMHTADDPERIRSANRLADNEGCDAVVVGLATDVAGRRCIHLDRSDAIVPLASGRTWGSDLGTVVEARGRLRRYASQNDPANGLSALELVESNVATSRLPNDGVIRSLPALAAVEGEPASIEGMAYRSSNGNIVVLYGGLVYVPDLPRWDGDTVGGQVLVHGVVRHGPPPPESPAAGGSWRLDDPTL